jgi:hypothetical protein
MQVLLFEKNETISHKLKKIFLFDYYFLLHKTSESTKNIFQKFFYAEINGALEIMCLDINP